MKKAFKTILEITIFFLLWAVSISIIDIPVKNPAYWRFFAELVPLVCILALTFIFIKFEKETVTIPYRKNFIKGCINSVLIGAIWILTPIILLLITKQVSISGINKVDLIGVWILSAFVNVIMQELLIKGYIYQLLKVRYNVWISVIFTTTLFTILHAGAFEAGFIAVLNVITMSLFTIALYEYEKTIIAPIIVHAIWNIVGCIIFGAIKLADDYPSLYSFRILNNNIFSGGSYKIEVSLIVTVINILLLIYFYHKLKKKNSRNI